MLADADDASADDAVVSAESDVADAQDAVEQATLTAPMACMVASAKLVEAQQALAGATLVSPIAGRVGSGWPDRTEIKDGLVEGDRVVLADLETPVPTNDRPTGPGGFVGAGPVRMNRPQG